MKKIINVLICYFLLTSFTMNTAFANPIQYDCAPPVTIQSELLPSSEKSSKVSVTGVKRGNFFGIGDLTIINENGSIGVSAIAYMKEPVDSLYMTIYLDRQINGKWSQVAYYDYEFHSKDYPDGMMTPGVDFTITDQPTGYYYRLRGSYIAFLNGESEGFGPVTHGILID